MANQAKSRIAALVFGVVMLAAVPACAQWGGGYGGTPTPAPQDRDDSGYGGRAPRGDSGYQRGPWRRDRDYDDERPRHRHRDYDDDYRRPRYRDRDYDERPRYRDRDW